MHKYINILFELSYFYERMFSNSSSKNNNNVIYGDVSSLTLKSFNKTTTTSSQVSREEFDIMRNKIEKLEDKNASIQSLIKDVVIEQLKTYTLKNGIQNHSISSNEKIIKIIEEEDVETAIRNIGAVAFKSFELNYPHLALIQYLLIFY